MNTTKALSAIRQFTMAGSKSPTMAPHFTLVSGGTIKLIGDRGGFAVVSNLFDLGDAFVTVPALIEGIKAGIKRMDPCSRKPESLVGWDAWQLKSKLLLDASDRPSITIPVATLKTLALVTGDHDIRYYLNGVCIDYAKRRLVSTNGHVCFVIDAAEIIPAAFASYGQMILHESDVDFMVRMAEATGAESVAVAWSPIENAQSAYAISLPDASVAVSSLPIDGKYPDYERIAGVPPKAPHRTIKTAEWLAVLPTISGDIKFAVANDRAHKHGPYFIGVDWGRGRAGYYPDADIKQSKWHNVESIEQGKFDLAGFNIDYLGSIFRSALLFDPVCKVTQADKASAAHLEAGKFHAIVMPART